MSVTLRSFIRLIHRSGMSLAFVVFLVACGGGSNDVGPTPDVTPAAGGMVMPTATTAPTANEVAATAMPEYHAGDQLAAVEPILLYNDATRSSLVMNQYGVDSAFTVLEPSGNDGAYPIEIEESTWYRVRAADGLVGWLPAELVSKMK